MHGQFQIIDFLDSFQLILDMWDVDGKLFMLDTNSNTTYDENVNQYEVAHGYGNCPGGVGAEKWWLTTILTPSTATFSVSSLVSWLVG